MHHGEKFFHRFCFILMIFVVEEYFAVRAVALELIVGEVFERRKLADQDIADKCGSKLGGGRHVSGGLLIQFQDNIRMESGFPAQSVSPNPGVIAGCQHDKWKRGKCFQRN